MISRKPALPQVRSVVGAGLPNGGTERRARLVESKRLEGVLDLVREASVIELGSERTSAQSVALSGMPGETYSELDGDTFSLLSHDTSGMPRLPTVSHTPIALTVMSFPVPRASRTLV